MKRQIESKLQRWKETDARKPLILNGARQIGKTYSLIEIGKTNFRNLIYINFEAQPDYKRIFDRDVEPLRILQEINMLLGTSIKAGQDLLFFDEIQECPRALTSLKYFCETLPDLHVCAAGSLLGLELNEAAFPVGKVEMLDMHPLSFHEFLLAADDKLAALTEQSAVVPEAIHKRLWDYLKKYFILGGLPEVIASYIQHAGDEATAFENARQVQLQLIQGYIADMAKHSGKQNAMHLERIWKNIPVQLARKVDLTTSKYSFKGVIPKIDRYSRLVGSLDWLEKAGLVIRVPILDHIDLPLSAQVQENTFKLYIFDVGLLGALSGLSPQTLWAQDYGSYKGYFAENFVAQELIAHGRRPLFGWEGRTSEVEFVLDIAGKIIPVEVKAGHITRSQSMNVYQSKFAPQKGFLLSARNAPLIESTWITHLPLYQASKIGLS